MKKLILILSLVYSLGNARGQTTYSKEIQNQVKQVENNLSGRIIIDGKPYNILDRMRHYNVKGLSIAVVRNYKLVWAKGYGWANEKEKRPVTIKTLFKPGSISKSLNAVAVLKLAQDKRLDLYTDINEYLRSWKFPYDSIAKGKKITLANLLSHTGGLSVYGGFPGYALKSNIPTIPAILDGKKPANTPAVRSLFEPGQQFQYSGGGIIISQLIITDLTHQPYEKFMYDSVLKPMGMLNSFYSALPPARNKLDKIAMGYTSKGAEVEATFHVYPEQAPLGLWTTPTELAGFMIQAQLAYSGKPKKFIDQQMAKLLLTPYIDNSATMGAFIGDRNGEKYFFHDAANEGYRGLYYGSVEGGNGLVVFVNSDDGNIILELLNSVASVYNWKGFDKPQNVNTIKLPQSIAQKYPGVYLYDGRIAEISNEKDGLYFWTEGQNCKMYFTTEKDFVNMEFQSEKSFILDSAENVIGYKRKVNGKEFSPASKIGNIDTLKAIPDQINSFAWHLLETKRFGKAILYLNRELALAPGDNTAVEFLAHCYLFNNEYDKAIKLYREYLDKKLDGQSSSDILRSDFEFFMKNSFDETLIKKAMAELKL
jgi:CubicO group peptidase (beta-lactamase class C family)